MKLTFQKNDLLGGINIVLKAVSSKTTMPILECILVDASTDEIRLLANDMELAIQTAVDGEILEPGKAAIDAKLFSEIVRKLPESEILLETDSSDNVYIACEQAHFRISGRNGNDFIALPDVERGEYICLSQFTLKEVIRQTIFSIAVNENNLLMTGELFEIRENRLRVVSLDGHRISVRNVELRDVYPEQKVVVPGKTLMEISRILPGERDSDVYIFFGRNHVMFEFDRTVVVSRLIEGEYFRIDQMIGNDYETRLSVSKKALTDSIERSILLIRESEKKPIVMNMKDDNLELTLTSMIGSMDENIAAEKMGNDLMIAFNPRFILDAMRVIDDETVNLYFVNAKTPCYIRDDEGTYIYLILPVNFNAGR